MDRVLIAVERMNGNNTIENIRLLAAQAIPTEALTNSRMMNRCTILLEHPR